MSLDPRQYALLQALVRRDSSLREERRPTYFMLLQVSGGRSALKPGVGGAAELAPEEADILDLESEGYVHRLPSDPGHVMAKFALTVAGRAAGQPRAVAADIQDAPREAAPPSSDDVLAWLHGLAASGPGSAILDSGGALINEARAHYGDEHIEAVARALVDLRDEGLLLFDDPLAGIDQIATSERVASGAEFRLTSAGRDRVLRGGTREARSIVQIIHATSAQVAAGDIHNYASFDELLDQVSEALEHLSGIDEAARDEARGILGKLRSASGTVVTGAATSAGGALLGGLLRQLLGLPL
jgi:hypothetical protein